MKRWRYKVKKFKQSPNHEPSFGIGFRFGYWPCVKGPYIQFGFGRGQISFWHGIEEPQ